MLDAPTDSGVWLDPYLMSAGYLALSFSILLSQKIRDGVFPSALGNASLFWFARKVGVLGFLLSTILGFFVIGRIWIIICLVTWISSNFISANIKFLENPTQLYYLILSLGLLLCSWAQSPTVAPWGIWP